MNESSHSTGLHAGWDEVGHRNRPLDPGMKGDRVQPLPALQLLGACREIAILWLDFAFDGQLLFGYS